MRNPEGIDLAKYPPPVGYVVASEEDVEKARGIEPIGWMWFAVFDWASCYPDWVTVAYNGINSDWTYLRPITTEDAEK